MFIFQTRTTFFSDCCLFRRAYLISSGQRYLVLASLWRIVLMGRSPFCLPFACARHHECTFERALLPKGSTSCHWCAHGGGTQRGVAERQEDTNHGRTSRYGKHRRKQRRFGTVFLERGNQQYICQSLRVRAMCFGVCTYGCKHDFDCEELHRGTFNM